MSHKLEQAARRNDPVEHSMSMVGAIGGAIAGIGLGLLLVGGTIASGGALLVVAGAAATTSGLFGWIGSHLDGFEDPIAEGSSNVFLGLAQEPAARVTDEVSCHNQPIISGCRHIYVNMLNAARATEETRCDGTIKEDGCCPTVHYGGPSVQIMSKRISGELSPVFFWVREGINIINLGRAGISLVTNWRKLALLERLQEIAKLFKDGYDPATSLWAVVSRGQPAPPQPTVEGVVYGLRPANLVERNPPLVPIEDFGVRPVRPAVPAQQANALPARRPMMLRRDAPWPPAAWPATDGTASSSPQIVSPSPWPSGG
jgi:uncharacterized Zn-binding protein involved in type VI secretion